MVSSINGIKKLNFDEALRLYDMLSDYLPDNVDLQKPVIEIVGTIVEEITEDHSSAYIDAIMLLTGHSLEAIAEFPVHYLLEQFVHGLMVNKIFELQLFCKEIGYGN